MYWLNYIYLCLLYNSNLSQSSTAFSFYIRESSFYLSNTYIISNDTVNIDKVYIFDTVSSRHYSGKLSDNEIRSINELIPLLDFEHDTAIPDSLFRTDDMPEIEIQLDYKGRHYNRKFYLNRDEYFLQLCLLINHKLPIPFKVIYSEEYCQKQLEHGGF